MAYVNNGYKRSYTIRVTKTLGGVPEIGYPKDYNGKLAFPGYPALTAIQARRLTDSQYNARMAAFKSYVESIEAGLDVDNDATNISVVYDPTTCPPPPTTTTTTTTAAPTTTTTTTAPVTTTTTTAAPTTTTTTTAPVTTTTTTGP